MVFVAHTVHFFPSGSGSLDGAFGLGRFGVQLFFILSGASVCLMWDARQNEPQKWRKFYIRRILRVAPLYWAFIPLSLWLTTDLSEHWAPGGISWQDITANFFLVHALWPESINSVVPGGWSISVEVFFYLAYPLVAFALGRRASLYLVLGMLIWGANLALPGLVPGEWVQSACQTCPSYLIRDFLFLSPINQFPAFLLGCAIYHVHRSSFNPMAYGLLLTWAFLAGLWGIFSEADRALFGMVYLVLGLFALACISLDIRNSALQKIGQNSYALYLCHFILLDFFSSLLNRPAGWPALLAGGAVSFLSSYLLAYWIHRWIDPAVHSFQNQLFDRMDRTRQLGTRPQDG